MDSLPTSANWSLSGPAHSVCVPASLSDYFLLIFPSPHLPPSSVPVFASVCACVRLLSSAALSVQVTLWKEKK